MKARERISLHRLILHTGVKPELVKGVFNFFIVFLHFPRGVFFFANLRLCVSVQNRWHSWPCPARTAAVTLVGWDPAPTSRRKTRHLGLGWAEQALSQSWTEAFQDLPRPPPTHPLTSQWAGCSSPNCGFTSRAACRPPHWVWEARDPREPHFYPTASLTAQRCTFDASKANKVSVVELQVWKAWVLLAGHSPAYSHPSEFLPAKLPFCLRRYFGLF